MLKSSKAIIALITLTIVSMLLAGCNPPESDVTSDSAPSTSEANINRGAFRAPIAQPNEFIVQKAQGLSDHFVYEADRTYTEEENSPDVYVKSKVDNKYGAVEVSLYKNPVPLIDSKIASGIGQAVINKANDIAKNPDKYDVEIHMLSTEKMGQIIGNYGASTDTDTENYEIIYDRMPNGDYGMIYNPDGNKMAIEVTRYAFNNIIAYSIEFSVPDKRVSFWNQGRVLHHLTYRFGMNFNAKTGELITLKDVFANNVDYKTELNKYFDYLSFIDESPKIRDFNHEKMFLLTPTYILVGDNMDKLYCGVDQFGGDNFFNYTYDGETNDHVFTDVKYSSSDMPLRFFGESIAIFERYKTTQQLFDNTVQTKSFSFPSKTLYNWKSYN